MMGGLTEEDETAVEDELAEMISQSLPSVPSEELEQMEGVEVPESPVKGALVLMLLFVT